MVVAAEVADKSQTTCTPSTKDIWKTEWRLQPLEIQAAGPTLAVTLNGPMYLGSSLRMAFIPECPQVLVACASSMMDYRSLESFGASTAPVARCFQNPCSSWQSRGLEPNF